jgi:2,4-dienoyl-CoA reductase-like NADH-dependent reductase (Old Yellow Enzyme family)
MLGPRALTSFASASCLALRQQPCCWIRPTSALFSAIGGSATSMNSPVTFPNGKTAKNRFGIASLTNTQSNPDGTLHDNELKWLVRRAVGGYGIINTCCVHVQANGKGWEGELGCFSDAQLPGFQTLVKEIKAVDPTTLVIVQVFHGGMRADEKLIEGFPRSCVDTMYHHRAGVRECKGLTEPEIEVLIQDFVKACLRCQEAGCDGVELHGAHGYILTQFLCPDLNQRTDKWGGKSLVNRARLLRTVMQEARIACGKDFIIGVRLSPEPGYEKAGWNMDPDENVQLAQWLAEDSADFISVSLFGHSPTKITAKHLEKYGENAKPLIQVFTDALPDDIVVMCCGGVKSANDVQTLLDMGVDVAVTGQTCIGTPDFPKFCQADPSFVVTETLPPWTPDYLASVDVSPPFVDFLDRTFRWVKQPDSGK